MNSLNRRQFIQQTAIVASGMAIGSIGQGVDVNRRKMTLDLVCGAIGVKAMQMEAIELASKHGFESVEAQPEYLAMLNEEQAARLKADMKTKNLVFGAAGLPVEFRRDAAQFSRDMAHLPELAAGLKRAGVGRVTTWIMPCHQTMTYRQQFRQHAERLHEVAQVLGGFEVRLGLEYVGPKTTWTSQRFPFIHTMMEMKELLAAIDCPNTGFLLDSWHWWHAGETAEDILTLKPEQVVGVDLNDAPAGIAKENQVDSRRELPCATGVIDVAAFLNALNRIGYDGPIRAEPFNAILAKMAKDGACAATAEALKKAFNLIN